MLHDNQVVQIQGVSLTNLLASFKEIVKDEVKSQNQVPTIGTPETLDRYVNRNEARGILGAVSDPTLWAWENAGIIKGYRMGNKVFYKYSELMQSGKFVDRTKK